MLTAVILAAGESRRMGSPKALLLYNDRTFLEHLLDITKHPKVGSQRVVLGAKADDIAQRVGLDPKMTIHNPDWEKGQLSSIQAALHNLDRSACHGVMICLIDHPLISSALVNQLIEAFYSTGKPIVVPVFRGRRGHPVIFGNALFEELLAAPADLGARAVVWKHADDVTEVVTEEEGAVMNLNDPATFRRAIPEN